MNYFLTLLCVLMWMNIEAWASPMPYVIQNQASIQNSGKKSVLVFDPKRLDLREVMEGDKISVKVLIRNTGKQTHQVVRLESSCGCTSVEPDTRVLAAGGFTVLHIDIDSFGKRGDVKKSIVLTDEQGNQSTAWLHLHVKKNPHAMNGKRSLFDGSCGRCHFDPAKGKETGRAIYAAVCVMCHGQNAKGGYAPSLHHHDLSVLQHLITHGTGTHHMPAFSQKQGGPLNTMQINALSRWIISLDD